MNLGMKRILSLNDVVGGYIDILYGNRKAMHGIPSCCMILNNPRLLGNTINGFIPYAIKLFTIWRKDLLPPP
jgi:hypothetical protein